MLFFVKNLVKNLLNFIKENKMFFALLIIVTALGIAFGFENVKQLKSDIDLEDITDNCFTNASKGKWPIYTFYFNRLLIMLIPFLLIFLCFHFAIIPIIFVVIFADAYSFSFNFMILVYNLSTVGLVYVFLVCLPCYFIYLLSIVMLALVALFRFKISKKYNTICFNDIVKQIKMPICAIVVLFVIFMILESIFLYVIYNKYIFAMS